MQSCSYTTGRMAAATGSFDLGSLVPKIPGAGLISQLSNPWHWVSVLSLVASFVDLLLYYQLRSNGK